MADRSFTPTLGARSLQEKEINLSLPTFPKLLEQIEMIRKNTAAYQSGDTESRNSQNAFLRPQVINNLSVLGPRGSGKSSVLKTLYHCLEEKKDKNILLPPIVPENLESHMTLMSSLLGLLNDQVVQLAKKRQPSCPVCPPEKDLLEKEYRQLVECYVHLQKPYQDISIQKYSTESDYVRTMSKVFEAGNQFSWKLWDFIDHLLGRYDKDALLFVFIDDIDLSTYRCSDVVRTLLGYISHPRVVTILAGDIEVFGEALTLDFLRQEGLLGRDGVQENYTVSKVSSGEGKNLLNRKKELAYEYLKKVMPPMNRHSISVWTLSNRGRFCPSELYDSADEKAPTLQKLLSDTNRLQTLLNGYFSAPGPDESKTDSDEAKQEGADQVLYHLFDSTARGLINCYIPIEQLVSQWSSEEKRFENTKFTLEAVVFSNSGLNALRDLIFSRFLQFGTENSSTDILFGNFNDWTVQQLPYLTSYGVPVEKDENQPVSGAAEDPKGEVRVFQIFVYLDWATRLLGRENVLNSEDYEIAKKRALFLLCANGDISEKTEKLPAAARKQLYQLGVSNFRKYPDCAAAVALRCFFGISFPLAVRYFRTFDISRMLEALPDYAKKKYTETIEDKLHRVVDFLNTLREFYRDDLSGAGACLAGQPEMLELISRWVKRDQSAMLVSVICNAYFKTGENKELSPLYEEYCKNGVMFVQQEELQIYYLPYSIHQELEKKQISDYELDSYLGRSPKQRVSDNAFAVLRKSSWTNGGHIVLGDPISSAASHCAYYWRNLLEEDGDPSAAVPIYNFYSECFWKRISDETHRLRPLADVYADPRQLVKKLCSVPQEDTQPMEQCLKSMEQRLKILFAIDTGGLWSQAAHAKEDESPIRQIKTYILSRLKASEKGLADRLDFSPEVITETLVVGRPLVTASGVCAAYDQLKNTYTGGWNTLANRCIRFLKPIFEGDNPDSMTVLEYIYAKCVLLRLIQSTAWYGKPEAREIFSVLDRASLDLQVENFPDELECYTFWLHCYCRYRMAELSEGTYAMIEQICAGMNMVEEAGRKADQKSKNTYFEEMQEKGGLEAELIQRIPKLFK